MKIQINQKHVVYWKGNIKRDTVSKFIQRFEDTGSTDDLSRPGRPVTACSPENREIIRGAFSLCPAKSTRCANKSIIYYSLQCCEHI